MKELLLQGGISYRKLESAREVEKLDIPEEEGGFDFFHGLGIIGYEQAFKMWLRRFPRPILIVAVSSGSLVGWTYVEEWPESSMDGRPVHVLRAIEVHPDFRRKGIGSTLMVLALKEIIGYMILKPLTEEGKSLFRGMGFKAAEEFRRAPVDLSKQPNYLILPPYKREKIINEFSSRS